MQTPEDQLTQLLQNLLDKPVENAEQLSQWYVNSEAVYELVKLHQLEMPELVWHYLSDADIRLKEPLFGDDQIQAVKLFIGASRSGEN